MMDDSHAHHPASPNPSRDLADAAAMNAELIREPLKFLELEEDFELVRQLVIAGCSATSIVREKEGLRRKLLLKVPNNFWVVEIDQQAFRETTAEEQSEIARQFMQEACVLDQQCPFLPTLYRAGPSRAPYLIMELLTYELDSAEPSSAPGVFDLLETCEKLRPKPRRRLQMVRDATEGLAVLHEAGIVHGDIKPANIMVKRGIQTDPRVVLIDFGFTIRALAALTGNSALGGCTEAYASPQVIAGDIPRFADDVYSMGKTLEAVLNAVETPIPQELTAIIHKATSTDIAERYRTARELADDLQRFLNNELVRAMPPSWSYRLTTMARRHRGHLAFLAISLLLTGLLALSIHAGWSWGRSNRLNILAAELKASNADLTGSNSQLELTNAKLEATNTQLTTSQKELEVSNAQLKASWAEEKKAQAQTQLAQQEAEQRNRELDGLMQLIKRQLLFLEVGDSGRVYFEFPLSLSDLNDKDAALVVDVCKKLMNMATELQQTAPGLELLLAAGNSVAPLHPELAASLINSVLDRNPNPELRRVAWLGLAASKTMSASILEEASEQWNEQLSQVDQLLSDTGYLNANPTANEERYATYLSAAAAFLRGEVDTAERRLNDLLNTDRPIQSRFDISLLSNMAHLYGETDRYTQAVDLLMRANAGIQQLEVGESEALFKNLASLAFYRYLGNKLDDQQAYQDWEQAFALVRELHSHNPGDLCISETRLKLEQASAFAVRGAVDRDASQLGTALAIVCELRDSLWQLDHGFSSQVTEMNASLVLECLMFDVETNHLLNRLNGVRTSDDTETALRQIAIFHQFATIPDEMLDTVRMIRRETYGRVRDFETIAAELQQQLGDRESFTISEADFDFCWRALNDLKAIGDIPSRELIFDLLLAMAKQLYSSDTLAGTFDAKLCKTWLGLMHFGAGNWKEAIQSLEAGQGLSGVYLEEQLVGDSERSFLIGRCYLQLRQFDKALEAFNRTVVWRHKQNYPTWQKQLALAFQGQALIDSGVDPKRGKLAIEAAVKSSSQWWPSHLRPEWQAAVRTMLETLEHSYLTDRESPPR